MNSHQEESQEETQEQTIMVIMDFMTSPIPEHMRQEALQEAEQYSKPAEPSQPKKENSAEKAENSAPRAEGEAEGEAKGEEEYVMDADEFGEEEQLGDNGLDIPSESIFNEPVEMRPKVTIEKVRFLAENLRD